MSRPTVAEFALHSAADVALRLRCSEWWVKEQARKRVIPFSWIGGSYRFTDEHVTEIVRIFEKRPLLDAAQSPQVNRVPKQRSGDSDENGGQLLQLKPRVPRRARGAITDQAV